MMVGKPVTLSVEQNSASSRQSVLPITTCRGEREIVKRSVSRLVHYKSVIRSEELLTPPSIIYQ